MTGSWRQALADLTSTDRVLWALEAPPCALGEVIDATPANHTQRLRELLDQAATVVVCTPSDALRLAEVASRGALAESVVRLVVLAGEIGGSVPSTRRRIEDQFFPAHCRDVYYLGQIGAAGWQCGVLTEGVHIAQELEPRLVEGELVLTWDGAVYRTGDLVEPVGERCACGRETVVIRGRKQDLLSVRGIDILPSTIENIVRRHPAVIEYRLDAYHVRGESELGIEIEPDEAVASEGDRARVAAEVAEDVKRSLGLRLQCEAVPAGSLPRDDPRPVRVVRRS